MSRKTSVTDRVGGQFVCLSEGDLYSRRKTLSTAVETTVAASTDVRNLDAPGWPRSWILRRSLGWGNFSATVEVAVESAAGSGAGSPLP